MNKAKTPTRICEFMSFPFYGVGSEGIYPPSSESFSRLEMALSDGELNVHHARVRREPLLCRISEQDFTPDLSPQLRALSETQMIKAWIYTLPSLTQMKSKEQRERIKRQIYTLQKNLSQPLLISNGPGLRGVDERGVLEKATEMQFINKLLLSSDCYLYLDLPLLCQRSFGQTEQLYHWVDSIELSKLVAIGLGVGRGRPLVTQWSLFSYTSQKICPSWIILKGVREVKRKIPLIRKRDPWPRWKKAEVAVMKIIEEQWGWGEKENESEKYQKHLGHSGP